MENNKCKTCNGTGIEYDGAGHTCTACNGALVPPAGVICDEVAPITEQAWRSLDSQPAGEEPGAIEGLLQLVIGPYPDPDVEDAHDEYLDGHQSQALWLLRNAGRIEAHVTRLTAENARLQAELKEVLHTSIKEDVFDVVCKERDALKAEVEELKNNMNSWMHCAAERLQMWTDSQSELTEARELLKLFRRALNGGGDQLSGMEHGKAFRDVTAFLAHQSGPAACITPEGMECPGDGVSECKRCPNAPAAKPLLVECDACPTSGGCVEKCMKAPAAKGEKDPRCCCPPQGFSGLWAAGPCPTHMGFGAVARQVKP